MHADASARHNFCSIGLCPEAFSRERSYEPEHFSAAESASPALSELKRALQLNPASADAWANLGEAESSEKNVPAARYCFERSLALGPADPTILFRAADFAFQSNDTAGTLRNLSTVLKNPELASYYEAAFFTYSRMNLPIEQILDQGIPAAPAAGAFLRYYLASDEAREAAEIWKWLTKHMPADDKLAGEYISFLLRNHRTEEAAEIWKGFTAHQAPAYRATNFVYNGGFEEAPASAPLDWKLNSLDDVLVSRVQSLAYEGDWSLRVFFEGLENIEFHQASQDVVVTPGRWRLRAYLKTEQITTDQGVALRLFDPLEPGRLDFTSDAFTGDHAWTRLQRSFEVGPRTKLLRLELTRHASTKFDNKISGSAWLDSVELSPIH